MEQTTSVMPFAFEDHLVRVVMRDGEPWFVAKDVAGALSIVWKGDETLSRIRAEWKVVRNFRTTSGDKDTIFINEPAVYKLAFRSSKPEAERFSDWVASEVLPQIRKTGRYEADAVCPGLLPGHPEFPHAVRLVREARLAHGPRAAMALWRALGLPWVSELDALPDVGRACFGPELSRFIAECVVPVRGVDVTARTLYRAYVAWAEAAGRSPVSETRFGRDAKGHLEHAASSRNVMVYRNIRLANLPAPEGAA